MEKEYRVLYKIGERKFLSDVKAENPMGAQMALINKLKFIEIQEKKVFESGTSMPPSPPGTNIKAATQLIISMVKLKQQLAELEKGKDVPLSTALATIGEILKLNDEIKKYDDSPGSSR